jgi:hypothetical protein
LISDKRRGCGRSGWQAALRKSGTARRRIPPGFSTRRHSARKRSRLRSAEMLQHVRGIDRIDGAIGMGDAVPGIGMPDVLAGAEGDEGKSVPVHQAEPRAERRQHRTARQPDRRPVVVVDPVRRR